MGEVLPCLREDGNPHDRYDVAVKKSTSIVGHVPRRISTLCYMFLRRGGAISCIVTGTRRYSYDLPQGGMEIPCQLKFSNDDTKSLQKIKKLLAEYLKDRDRAKAPLDSSMLSYKAYADVESSTSTSSSDSSVSVKVNPNLHADGDTEIWVQYDRT